MVILLCCFTHVFKRLEIRVASLQAFFVGCLLDVHGMFTCCSFRHDFSYLNHQLYDAIVQTVPYAVLTCIFLVVAYSRYYINLLELGSTL
jgi:hypothetical protein